MRILQLCSAKEIGGGERHLVDLAAALVRRGHEVFAAVTPGSPLLCELSFLPTQNILQLRLRNALSVQSAMKLARFIKVNQIEIVHAHVARDYPLAALPTGKSRARLVLTRHVLFPLSRIHRLTLKRTLRVIAVSQAVADSLRAQNIFPPDRIVVIHNGIDVDRFAGQTKEPAEHQRLCVGMTGHLAPIKGQEDFIRAAAIVCERRADVDFVIAGEDKSKTGENRRRLEELIMKVNLSERVRMIGWVDDVAGLLPAFDLFVSPSRSEPFGLAIIEAMAAGVPVIATSSEGAREIISDDRTGRLVPVADPPALANAICELLDDPTQRRSLADYARRIVRQRFSVQRMVDETLEVYRQTLDEEV